MIKNLTQLSILKYGLICLFCLPFFASAQVVEWQDSIYHDFGLIEMTDRPGYTFAFKNITQEPITIDNIRTACGCTVPEWEEAPIFPDSIAQIKVYFSPKREGFFLKKIKVYVSAQRRPEILYVEGEVE